MKTIKLPKTLPSQPLLRHQALARPTLSRLERTVIDALERERHAGRPVRFIIADGRTDSAAVRSAILTYVAWYFHIVPGQNIILSAPL